MTTTEVMSMLQEKCYTVFRKYHIYLDEDIADNISHLSYYARWVNDALWRSWASELDDTQLFYLLPDRYEALSRLTNTNYAYQKAQIGDIQIYILGFTTKQAKFGPYIDERVRQNLSDCLPYLGTAFLAELKFALLLQNEINKNAENFFMWRRAFANSQQYFKIHRDMILRVSGVLNLFCPGHDLTKTRVVLAGLGYWWHWVGEHNEEILQSAISLCNICHLEIEDHHPQCGETIDYELMFVDRISVHMQKSQQPIYENRGFDIDPKFIPIEAADKWIHFKERFKHINLWDHTQDILHKFDIDTDAPPPPQTIQKISQDYTIPHGQQFSTYRQGSGRLVCDCMDDITKLCCINDN